MQKRKSELKSEQLEPAEEILPGSFFTAVSDPAVLYAKSNICECGIGVKTTEFRTAALSIRTIFGEKGIDLERISTYYKSSRIQWEETHAEIRRLVRRKV